MKHNKILIIATMLSLSFGIRQKATAAFNNNVKDACEYYSAIDNALTNDDASSAQKAAGKLLLALKDIEDAGAAIKAASGISSTNNIADQRKSFAALTVKMNNIFKKEKPGKMLYIHYCPMAKAYWMDESREIHNPYFGKAMPSCGKTTGMIM